jgi:phage shock protein PspC (stress-responsive transcriptional regulator)
MEKKLERFPNDSILGGVASGMATYLNVDKTIVRILWVVAALGLQAFLVLMAYIILWLVLPESNAGSTALSGTPQSSFDPKPNGGSPFAGKSVKVLGFGLLAIGGYLLIEDLPFWDQVREYFWPAALIGAGAYLILRQRDQESQEAYTSYSSPIEESRFDPQPPKDTETPSIENPDPNKGDSDSDTSFRVN